MKIKFEQNKTIEISQNQTILELALANEIPMTHACGGNARCSTCRIMIIEGQCPPRNQKEAQSPQLRLSC